MYSRQHQKIDFGRETAIASRRNCFKYGQKNENETETKTETGTTDTDQ